MTSAKDNLIEQIRHHDGCEDGIDAVRALRDEHVSEMVAATAWADLVAVAARYGLADYVGWAVGRLVPVGIMDDANLSFADLRGTDLRGANLSGVGGCGVGIRT